MNSEQEARRATTRLSRAIVDACEAYPERADDWAAALDAIRGRKLSGKDEAAAIDVLHRKVIGEVTEEYVTPHMSREGDIDVAPNINTTSQNSFESKISQPRSDERAVFQEKDDREAVVLPTEKGFDAGGISREPQLGAVSGSDKVQSQILGSISVSLIRSACPEASKIAGRAFKSWPELTAAADVMRVMIGLSEAAWTDGASRVGRYAAAAILVTVLEKSLRNPEQISSPGGYFRAMVDRGVDGSLRLEKSLFGLADGALKRPGPNRDQIRGLQL